MSYKNIYNMYDLVFKKVKKWFTLLELLIVIVIIGIIFSAVNYINYAQIDNIKQTTKIDAFVSNYNQILLNCMTNNCVDAYWNAQKWAIATNWVINYPTWQNPKLSKTDWLIIENGDGLTLSFSDYTCDSQQSDIYKITLKNINSKSTPKCFEIDKKCKLYAAKCTQ